MGKRRLQRIVWLIGIISIYSVLEKVFKIGCPFQYFFQFPCAGCGMTRAWQNILSGNIKEAVYYHPLFWSVPLMAGMIIFADRFSKRFQRYFWGAIVAVYGVVYVIRVLTYSGAILG